MEPIQKMNAKELLSDAFPIIQKFAPAIAGAIGGPTGFALGYLVPILANAFGAHPNNMKEIIANIINDPLAANKLGEIEREHGDWLCTVTDNIDRLITAEINIKLEWAQPKN